MGFIDSLKQMPVTRPPRRLPIGLNKACPVLFSPPWAPLVVDLNLIDGLMSTPSRQDRNRDPYAASSGPDSISILKVVLSELNVIEKDDCVGSAYLIKEP